MEKSETLKAWAAGIFDGEGSPLISCTRQDTQDRFCIVVKIATTDPEISNSIQEAWNGRLPAEQDTSKYGLSKRLNYTISFSRREALVFLKDIRPYTKTRLDRVDIVIKALEACQLYEELNPRFTQLKRTPGISEIIAPFYEQLKQYSSDLKKGRKIGS